MTLKQNGRLGIGTTNPQSRLDVFRDDIRSSHSANLFVSIEAAGANGFIRHQGNGNLNFQKNGANF